VCSNPDYGLGPDQQCARTAGHDGPHFCLLRNAEPQALLFWPAVEMSALLSDAAEADEVEP